MPHDEPRGGGTGSRRAAAVGRSRSVRTSSSTPSIVSPLRHLGRRRREVEIEGIPGDGGTVEDASCEGRQGVQFLGERDGNG
jgi:hypothetical protein